MANKNRFELDIKLAGESFTLRPTLEAIAEMEDRSGYGIQGLMNIAQEKNLSTKIIFAVLYAGIMGGGVNKKYEDVAQMCLKHGIGACLPLVYQFLTLTIQSMNPDSSQKKT